MKRARLPWVSILGSCAVSFWVASLFASADPDPANVQFDPDGNPVGVVSARQQQQTEEEAAEARRQQEQAAHDKDWLLRGYERQLQTRALADPEGFQNNDLYYQISSDKELARVAGLPAPDPGSPALPGADPGTVSPVPAPVRLPAATPLQNSLALAPGAQLLKPLFTPLSAPDAAGLHSLYSPLPASMLPALAHDPSSAPAPTPNPEVEADRDSLALETPGMVSSPKDPLTDPSASDLDLDVLPGETAAQARREQQNRSGQTSLPTAMDASQLHKTEASQLAPPRALPVNSVTAETAAAAPTVKPILPNPEDEPTPASQLQPISPVRSPIANPYAILNQ